MISPHATASAIQPIPGATASDAAPDETLAPTDPSPANGSTERSSGHWFDLALALWLEESPSGHAPSPSAGDH
jgi:hypothetical protein